jgi:hypothetical protein
MKWLLLSRQDRRRAVAWTVSGWIAIATAGVAGGLASPSGALFWTSAGFVSFILCLKRAIALWRVDEIVFDRRRQWNPEKPASIRAFRSARKPQRAGSEQSYRVS